MQQMILNQELRSKLNGLDKQLEFRDEAGNLLGMFLPPEVFRKLAYGSVQLPFSEQEIERRRKEAGGGSLEEFWKRMGAS